MSNKNFKRNNFKSNVIINNNNNNNFGGRGNNNSIQVNNFLPTDSDINHYLIGEDITGKNMSLSDSEETIAYTIDTFAPLRGFEQITSIVGAAGCGKTTSIKNLIKYYAQEYNIQNVAVISINERAGEAFVWEDLNLKYLYCVSSKDNTYNADQKIEIVKSIIDKVNNDNTIELVVLDSITGWYELIANSSKPATKGFGDGGYRADIFDDIWQIVSNIKAKYLLCSIIQNKSKVYSTLNEAFNSKADSTIYLEAELTRMGVYNNVNPYKSFTRRANYSELRNDALDVLNAFGGSFRALISLEAIEDKVFGKDYFYPLN